MKALKTVLYVLVAVAVVAVAAGYLVVPADTHVERSVKINASPRIVYGLVSDFRQFNKWSPWAKMDPDTEYRFEGPDSGTGAVMHWSSDHPHVGSGRQKITEAEPYSKVVTALDFGEMGQATADFELERLGDEPGQGTRVTWNFDTHHGADLIERYMGLMMDHWVGTEYEKGLANLKALAEERPEPAERQIVTEEVSYTGAGETLEGLIA
jgi:uncharacterized protein YndB with AHSA1/START domain